MTQSPDIIKAVGNLKRAFQIRKKDIHRLNKQLTQNTVKNDQPRSNHSNFQYPLTSFPTIPYD